jgi:uncharacterized protein
MKMPKQKNKKSGHRGGQTALATKQPDGDGELLVRMRLKQNDLYQLYHIQHEGLTMALHATPTSQSIRLAPLGIHYGLVHEALLKGETDLAHRLAQLLLQLGDASAQWYLGLMHHTGTGVKKDLVAARRWYELSAAQGFRMAEDGLLILAASEKKTRVDPALLKAAAFQSAYSNLKTVQCLARDTEVMFWELQRAADLGNVEVQILLGQCYEVGVFVPARWQFALEWYRRAGAQGSRTALMLYKALSSSKLAAKGVQERVELEFVCEMANNTTLKGSEPANAVDAFRWYDEAAQKDDRYACWRLSEPYLIGYGVERDLSKSFQYWNFLEEESFNDDNRCSEAHNDYFGLLLTDVKLIEHEQLLIRRKRFRVAMTRPISSKTPTSSHG